MEIPHLIALRNLISEDKLVIVAISNENPDLVKKFAEQKKLNYIVLLDSGKLPQPYSSVSAIPSSFFVDQKGQIKLATSGLLSLPEFKAIVQAQ